MSIDHYENFPVGSLALPARYRPAVVAIYRFARAADDIADEGDAPPEVRLDRLARMAEQIDAIRQGGTPAQPLFADLKRVMQAHDLPLEPLLDLLDAFRQDVTQSRYRDFPQLLDYCRRSANPVGRLLLRLYRAEDPENLRDSDAICTALQLTNFLQDVAADWDRGRIYLPQDEIRQFEVTESQIAGRICDRRWRALMAFQIDRTRRIMLDGARLGGRLPGRIGVELRLIVAGGLRILERIERNDADVFQRRPVLRALDWPVLLWRAVLPRRNVAPSRRIVRI
jgi:squalene synthase HpnC